MCCSLNKAYAVFWKLPSTFPNLKVCSQAARHYSQFKHFPPHKQKVFHSQIESAEPAVLFFYLINTVIFVRNQLKQSDFNVPVFRQIVITVISNTLSHLAISYDHQCKSHAPSIIYQLFHQQSYIFSMLFSTLLCYIFLIHDHTPFQATNFIVSVHLITDAEFQVAAIAIFSSIPQAHSSVYDVIIIKLLLSVVHEYRKIRHGDCLYKGLYPQTNVRYWKLAYQKDASYYQYPFFAQFNSICYNKLKSASKSRSKIIQPYQYITSIDCPYNIYSHIKLPSINHNNQLKGFIYKLFALMGNENNKQSSSSQGNKIVLRLRNRDIILHYAFKMKLLISDIALFPHELDGLRLWDTDVVAARFAILENNRFRGKDVMVFGAGVGISGIALKQWADCKNVVMCDTRDEVVQNMTNNCEKNGIRSIGCIKIQAKDIFKFASKFEILLLPDILNLRYTPETVIDIMRKYLKAQGEGIIVMPERKDLAKKLLDIVDRQQFKINNFMLTAQQYELSPLFNKMEGESEFPLLGKTNFYAIILTRISIQLPIRLRQKKVLTLKQVKQTIKQQVSVQKQQVQKTLKQQHKENQQIITPASHIDKPLQNVQQKQQNNPSPIQKIDQKLQKQQQHIQSPNLQQKASQ